MELSDVLTKHMHLHTIQKKALMRLGIETLEDLLYYFPRAYGDAAEVTAVKDLIPGQNAVIFGRISGLRMKKAWRRKIPMAEASVRDETGSVKVVWFNQPYLAKMLVEGNFVRIEGKYGSKGFSNPKIEPAADLFNHADHTLYPIYPETKGITSNWIYHAVKKVLARITLDVRDPIPEEILRKYNLPSLKTALVWIHTPKSGKDAEAARKRFAFEEIFMIQLEKQQARHELSAQDAWRIDRVYSDISPIIEKFPFEITNAQKSAIVAILSDFKKGYPMSRLLEGDVGSGKTAVAAAAAYAAAISKPKEQNFGTLQTAYMAPTEILAQQHFESFIKYFSHLPINIGLITGSGCRKFPSKLYAEQTRNERRKDAEGWTDISKSQLLKWVASGEITILIGTHALIQKSVRFKNLAFIVIDEQHRFGIKQRQALVSKNGENTARGLADKTPSSAESGELLYKDLTYRIREAIFAVKKELGPGHKEVVYQRALEEEFSNRKLTFTRERRIPIFYNKKQVGVYVPDFVIEDKVIVELKAIPFIGTVEKKQLWTYLKGSEYNLALLVNFGPQKLEIQRIIYDSARVSASSPQSSASVPHLLSMTATPIPRTLALTLYGDLDLTLLDQMPEGRKKIITEIVTHDQRLTTYDKIRSELKSGRQMYVICPRIDDPDPAKELAIQAKSVKAEAERLKKEVFQEYEIAILHSKMRPAEKERVMIDFKNKKIDVLVATSVVEVGVNVENASLIIIEGAERFGLSQLHQLRGRVLRGTHQPYCFVFSESSSPKTVERLKALKTAKNGFELAEFDLQQRGAGELAGTKQWGLSDLGMEAVKNIKMVEAARTEAARIIESDPHLVQHPMLNSRLQSTQSKIHFE